MSTTRCAECANCELSILHQEADLRRSAYAAQASRPRIATKAREDIPKIKVALAESRRRLLEHQDTCTAVDRRSYV